jgi:hypothetical protein
MFSCERLRLSSISRSDAVNEDIGQFTGGTDQRHIANVRCPENADFQRIGMLLQLFCVAAELCP